MADQNASVVPLASRRPGRPHKDPEGVSVRDSLLEVAIESVAKHGPHSLTSKEVSEIAGAATASVNYNFGSWNGLLAEAAAVVYTRYVDELWQAVLTGPQTPDARLRSYIQAQLDFARRMPGWGAVFNYPISVEEVSALYREKFPEVAIGLFELNLARLAQLTIDVREGSVTPFDYDATNYPREQLFADKFAFERSTSVGWSAIGAALWASRGHFAANQMGDLKNQEQRLVEFHIQSILDSIKSDRS